MISEELIDEIKKRNDIVDVVSGYVSLKRKGRNYFGLCPFHNEKSPSLSVSPDRQIFKCFGCGVGGDVFHFISKIENLSWIESVKFLASRVNIQIPDNGYGISDRNAELKSSIYKINMLAAKAYHEYLFTPEAKIAQDYVVKRKLNKKTLDSFLIGFAPQNNELTKFLIKQGFKEKELLESNLVGKSEKTGILYDKFKNRLMIPISDIRNRIIGFGGRVLDDSKPKYINSPTNLVYDKGRNLFGLNVVKKENYGMLDRILIVEGYMDAISLYERGVNIVVASLGTALTDNQARLLRKNAKQIILGYDADEAGQTAILRAIGILEGIGVNDLRVLQISGAKDPDEYIIKYGKDAFMKCLDNSISSTEFRAKILKKGLDLDNPADKIKFLNGIADLIAKNDNMVEREIFINKISQDYKISKEAIYSEVNKRVYKNSEKEINTNNVINNNIYTQNINKKTETTEEKVDEKTLKTEQMLIYILATYGKKAYDNLKDYVKVNLIKDKRNKQIISKIYDKYEKNENDFDIINIFSDNEEISNYLSGILVQEYDIEDENKAIDDIKKIYERKYLEYTKKEIIEKLKNVQTKEEEIELEKKLNDVIVKIVKIR